MPQFRKKPVVIEAIKWDGKSNTLARIDLLALSSNMVFMVDDGTLSIATLEGEMTAQPGDWIIRGVKGELYPCKPDIFEATYEPA